MVDARIAATSARLLAPVFATSTWSDDEAYQRHLVAIHSPDAPKDHPFHPNTVPARYAPVNLASRQNVTRLFEATQAEIMPSGPSVGLTVPGLDYSAKPGPSVQALQAYGAKVVFRYNPYGPGGAWKQWDTSERQGLHAARIGLQPNSEVSGSEPFGGASAGNNLGDQFVRSLEGNGVPKGTRVGDIYSMDTEVTSEGQMQNVLAFYQAYNAKMVNAGYSMGTAYCQYWVALRIAKELRLPTWQTYAWSYGSVWDAAACRQEGVDPTFAAFGYQYHNGITVGGNDADANWVDPYRMPAWWDPTSPYLQGDDSMSDADVAAVNSHMDAALAGLPKKIADAIMGYQLPWGDKPGQTQPFWAIARGGALASQGGMSAAKGDAIVSALAQINSNVTPLSGYGDKIIAAIAAMPGLNLSDDELSKLCTAISDQLGVELDTKALATAVAQESLHTFASALSQPSQPSPQLP